LANFHLTSSGEGRVWEAPESDAKQRGGGIGKEGLLGLLLQKRKRNNPTRLCGGGGETKGKGVLSGKEGGGGETR